MTKPFKLAFRLVFWTVVLVVVLALFRNVIAQAVLERHLRAITGMDVSIGHVRIGLTEPTLTLSDARMFNSDDFGRATCVDIPELYIEYDRDALWNRKVHLKKVRLDLAELLVVQNDEGKNNFRELLARPAVKSSIVSGHNYEFQGIDTLNLALGKFKYSDLKHPAEDDDLFIGLKGQVVRNVRSLDDVKPLLNRLALERNGKRFYDKCFSQPPKAPSVGIRPAGKDDSTNAATPVQPETKNP
jgi:uncharacterized protein involved in outer membrane biogenesis